MDDTKVGRTTAVFRWTDIVAIPVTVEEYPRHPRRPYHRGQPHRDGNLCWLVRT